MKIQSIRGFNDVLPADSALWQHLFDTARALFEGVPHRERKSGVSIVPSGCRWRPTHSKEKVVEKRLPYIRRFHAGSRPFRGAEFGGLSGRSFARIHKVTF